MWSKPPSPSRQPQASAFEEAGPVFFRHVGECLLEREAAARHVRLGEEAVGQDLLGHLEAEGFPEVPERHIDHPVAVADAQADLLTRAAVREGPVDREEAAPFIDDALVVDEAEEEPAVVVRVVGDE